MVSFAAVEQKKTNVWEESGAVFNKDDGVRMNFPKLIFYWSLRSLINCYVILYWIIGLILNNIAMIIKAMV